MEHLRNKINSSEMIAKHEVEDDRTKQSLYLSKNLYKKFKKACGRAPASRLMEDLMKIFIDDVKSRSAKGGKS